MTDDALDSVLNRAAGQRFHNRSPLDFKRLQGDPDNIDKHLFSYIKGFSCNVRYIFNFFEFEVEIEKMREASRSGPRAIFSVMPKDLRILRRSRRAMFANFHFPPHPFMSRTRLSIMSRLLASLSTRPARRRCTRCICFTSAAPR